MCGIAGLIYRKESPIDSNDIRGMLAQLKHRGPDDEGIEIHNNVVFGHRRLSIIDLQNGHQPMIDQQHQLAVTFNGEIYNHQQLKKLITPSQWTFKTQCDTEILLALWHLKGTEMVHDLEGMFAFAIHDRNKDQVFMAVDRFGQKPFYYSVNDHFFAFSSEAKPIKALPFFQWDLDPASLHHYLSYLSVPPPKTIYKQMNRLSAGRRLLYNLKTHQFKEDLWYHLNAKKESLNYAQAQEKLNDLLTQAVKKRLMSDVPLGAFLSGGIDSPIIVGLTQEILGKKIKTFSISTDKEMWDESDSSRRNAQYLGSEHYEKKVNLIDHQLICDFVSHLDEPFADSSLIPTYFVSQAAREHVTVALSGDAADESFGGYTRYRALLLSQQFSWMPAKIRTQLFRFIKNIAPSPHEERRFASKLNKFCTMMQEDGLKRYFTLISQFSEDEKINLYTDSFFNKITSFDSLRILEADFARSQATTLVEQMMDLDVNHYLQNDILVKVDRASMMHSLEVRSPFIDHQVMEFAFSLPLEYKIQANNQKKILKDTFKRFLPEDNLKQPKRGFSIPLGHWFRTHLKDFCHELLTDTSFIQKDIFNDNEIKTLIEQHLSMKCDHGQKLWALCVLALWLEKN